MKKSVVFLFCFLLVFSIFMISSAELDDTLKELEGIKEGVEKISEFQDSSKWEFLGQEWKTIFLRNEIVQKVDSFLSKFDIVFQILFAQNYSFSITLLVIILLWIFLFFNFKTIFSDYSPLGRGVSLIMALGITIVVAHMGIIREVVFFLGRLIFKPETAWMRFAIFFVISLVLLISYAFNKFIGKGLEKQRELSAKEREKIDRDILHKLTDALLRGLKD